MFLEVDLYCQELKENAFYIFAKLHCVIVKEMFMYTLTFLPSEDLYRTTRFIYVYSKNIHLKFIEQIFIEYLQCGRSCSRHCYYNDEKDRQKSLSPWRD